jgi:hypothetical protein
MTRWHRSLPYEEAAGLSFPPAVGYHTLRSAARVREELRDTHVKRPGFSSVIDGSGVSFRWFMRI